MAKTRQRKVRKGKTPAPELRPRVDLLELADSADFRTIIGVLHPGPGAPGGRPR